MSNHMQIAVHVKHSFFLSSKDYSFHYERLKKIMVIFKLFVKFINNNSDVSRLRFKPNNPEKYVTVSANHLPTLLEVEKLAHPCLSVAASALSIRLSLYPTKHKRQSRVGLTLQLSHLLLTTTKKLSSCTNKVRCLHDETFLLTLQRYKTKQEYVSKMLLSCIHHVYFSTYVIFHRSQNFFFLVLICQHCGA